MAPRKTVSADHRYSGRSYPRGRPHDIPHPRVHHEPSLEPTDGTMSEGEIDVPTHNAQIVQGGEDRHDVGYDNDHPKDWVRGFGADGATGRPGFDHSPPRDKMRR